MKPLKRLECSCYSSRTSLFYFICKKSRLGNPCKKQFELFEEHCEPRSEEIFYPFIHVELNSDLKKRNAEATTRGVL